MFRFVIGLLIVLLSILPIPAAQAQEIEIQEAPKPVLVNSEPITAGAVMREYAWDVTGGPAKVYVIEVDLKNPHVQIEVIPGSGKITQRLNVSAMAKNTGAVAAVNGDFFNTQGEGAPIGPMVTAGRLISSPAKLTGIYALGITADRKAHIDSFFFDGKVTAPNGKEFELSGLNKTIYWEEPAGIHSHADKLHLYNDMWGGKTRGHDSYTTPTEMLIDKGKVVDIVQGQYFDFPVPEGMLILRGHGRAASFLVENFKVGDPVDIKYSLEPARNWSMIVGGHALLVDEGKRVPYTKDISALGGVRARTAAGVSKDGSVLYLVGVEGRTANSKGLTLSNLSIFFETIGAWRAVNLDGGGSTTMVSRPLGEWNTTRVFAPEQANERFVVNAIGIFSSAPQGKLQGILLDGEKVLLIGEEAFYSIKAYDEFFNPVDASALPVNWSTSGPAGIMEQNRFTAKEPGLSEITARSGSITAKLPVEVIGKRGISSFTLSGTLGQVVQGSEAPLNLTLNTVSGKSRKIPAHLVDWQFYGVKGRVSEQGVLTIQDSGSSDYGFVVARYQGFSAPLALQFAGEKLLESFAALQQLSYQGHPAEVQGQLRLAADPQGTNAQVARLDYNFVNAAGTSAAYVRFNNGDGLSLDGNAQALLIDVYGNNSGEWLRAELQDGAGTVHRVDLAQRVNWSGWRTLQVDLKTASYTHPLVLKRIYPVVPEDQRGQRPLQGALYFKNLKLKFDSSPVTSQAPRRTLVLTVGQKELAIDGHVREMDVAPVIVNGRTLVPVRFISEALNSQVLWNGEARNATVIQGKRWIDLWPGDDIMVVDGQRVDLDVAPQLMNGRTMLPLRAVAQALDLTVHWDPATHQITLR
ncbi:MAG: stalk domain-containing protein [Bacillota bacterium]